MKEIGGLIVLVVIVCGLAGLFMNRVGDNQNTSNVGVVAVSIVDSSGVEVRLDANYFYTGIWNNSLHVYKGSNKIRIYNRDGWKSCEYIRESK